MDVLRRLAAGLLLALLLAGAGHAAEWRGVPGAPDLQVDVASLQHERTRVAGWLRWWGRPAFVAELAAWNARARVHRTTVRTEFDCSGRTMRVLAAHAYDGNGAPLFMSSVPGPAMPIDDAQLAWAYDAVCEAARAAGRL